jgi:hypothetical protein
MRALVGTLLAALLLGAGFTGPAPASADGLPLPLPTSPEGDVPGVNNWECAPTKARPRPIVVVHGTFGDRKHLLENLSNALLGQGYCVFSLDYGNRGTQDIPTSAQTLKAFTDKVLTATGARKVSMVGHSQGGMMPRHYIKFLGGRKLVDDLVGAWCRPTTAPTTPDPATRSPRRCSARSAQPASSSLRARRSSPT